MGIPTKIPELGITQRQKQLVDTLVLDGGTITAAAESIGASRPWACKVLKDPSVAAYYDGELKQKIQRLAARSLGTMESLLTSKSDHVKLEVAKDLMNRAGYAPPDKHMHAIVGDITLSIDVGE